MIYDCFTFFNELDVLEIRLNELANVVDKFVIVESPTTFTGLSKPLYYKENIKRFEQFNDKIIYVEAKLLIGKDKHWEREADQRNQILKGLDNAGPEDTIIISDVDEIPKSSVVKEHFDTNSILTFELYHTFYYLNLFFGLWHNGTRMLKRKHMLTPQKSRFEMHKLIKHAGWHLGYLGDSANVINKLKSFSHVEFNKPPYTDPQYILKQVFEGKGILGDQKGDLISIDLLPDYVKNNKDKFKKYMFKGKLPLILPKDMTHIT